MDINYSLFLDGVQIHDMPLGIDNLTISVIREDGISSNDQILRDVAETQLTFIGDGYYYLCSKRNNNYCEDILLSIMTNCNGLNTIIFEGIIKQAKVEVIPQKKQAKVTNIKDNSFSGLIRDFIDVEIGVLNLRTKNCQPIQLNPIQIKTNIFHVNRMAYDVLDIFKYIVSYFTDNRINVVSDYLTNIKYAITTGYNLRTNVRNRKKSYPTISFSKLFKELRAKEQLFICVEYEINGTPYLRIENENYFYSETDNILSIDGYPLDGNEYIDTTRIYNSLKIGSNTTEVDRQANDQQPYKSQDSRNGWGEYTFIGCSGCGGERENVLDIVNDFIIDANIIIEALMLTIDADADYRYDSNIFLLNYEYSGGENKLVGEVGLNYNMRTNNINTIGRWVGNGNSCYIDSRSGLMAENGEYNEDDFSDVYFMRLDRGDLCSMPDDYVYKYGLGFLNLINGDPINFGQKSQNATCHPANVKTYYKCNSDNNYTFKVSSLLRMSSKNFGLRWIVKSKFTFFWTVFSDDTLTTELYKVQAGDSIEYDTTSGGRPIKSIEYTTELNLQSGNCVMLTYEMEVLTGFVNSLSTYFIFYDSIFEVPICEDVTDNIEIFSPFVTELNYPLCISDFLKIKNNKKGFILLDNKKTWIKKIEYNHNKLSKLQLIHKETFCK